MTTDQAIKEEVRKRYGKAAQRAQEKAADSGCCGGDSDSSGISSHLYTTDEIRELPQEAVVASLGCGNPVAIAALREGETVLDLGSGGGIDVLLSARRVGPKGKAYGLDMTDEMLDLARENARKAGVTNVEFLKGEMEAMPLPDSTIDVIISNCVVNLSPDKDAVLREAHRVLTPGGRFAVADILTRGQIPEELKRSLELWAGCIAGALSVDDYQAKLAAAGFSDIEIETVREYTADDAESGGLGELVRKHAKQSAEPLGFISAIVRARKPGGAQRTGNSSPSRSSPRRARSAALTAVSRHLSGCDYCDPDGRGGVRPASSGLLTRCHPAISIEVCAGASRRYAAPMRRPLTTRSPPPRSSSCARSAATAGRPVRTKRRLTRQSTRSPRRLADFSTLSRTAASARKQRGRPRRAALLSFCACSRLGCAADFD